VPRTAAPPRVALFIGLDDCHLFRDLRAYGRNRQNTPAACQLAGSSGLALALLLLGSNQSADRLFSRCC